MPVPLRLRGNAGKVWFEQVALPRASRRSGIDLLHVPYWGSPLRTSCPVVVTVHDLAPLVLPEHRGSLLVRTYSRLVAASARRAAGVLADSSYAADEIIGVLGVTRERVRVAHLAAGEEFRPQPAERVQEVRGRYRLPGDFVLYVGGFEWRKNVGLLLRALTLAPECTLAIAGALPPPSAAAPDLMRMAAELGVQERCLFLGPIPATELPALYAAANLFAYPSRYEGFGLAPLEAMACGTPVVSSRATSLAEVLGDAALTFSPDDAGSLAGMLRRVWRDPSLRAELSARSLAQAARFSWAKTAEETVQAYERARSAAGEPRAAQPV